MKNLFTIIALTLFMSIQAQQERSVDTVMVRFSIEAEVTEKFLYQINKDTVLVTRYSDKNGTEYLKFSKPLNRHKLDSIKKAMRRKIKIPSMQRI